MLTMPVTMQDVARAAGVSAKTVSNVLGDYPYVREETRARVMAAVQSLGYQMNFAARNLRSGRTGLLMLALPELSLPYFAELADAVIDEARREGYTVLVERTGATRAGELDLLSGGRLRMVDGLIFSPLALGPGDVDALRVDFPMVLLGERIFDGPVDHVTMANVDGGALATRHLLSLGRRRIAVVGVHRGEDMGSGPLRLRGYAAALADVGLEVDPELLVEAGYWHRSTGAQATHRLIDSGVDFDAVFALNDALALGVLYALQRRGLRVPEDVAVIGFDNVDDGIYSTPSLSTVDPDRLQIARTAVALLLRQIAGDAGLEGRIELAPPVRLQIRESTRGRVLR
jgi:DNA-binding LacI/PurR family transcriptional regulator